MGSGSRNTRAASLRILFGGNNDQGFGLRLPSVNPAF